MREEKEWKGEEGGRDYKDELKSRFSSMEADGYFEISTLPPWLFTVRKEQAEG
jgi:hypothetical protein